MKHEKVFHAYLVEGKDSAKMRSRHLKWRISGENEIFVFLKLLNFRICDFCGFRIQFLDFFYQIVMTNMQWFLSLLLRNTLLFAFPICTLIVREILIILFPIIVWFCCKFLLLKQYLLPDIVLTVFLRNPLIWEQFYFEHRNDWWYSYYRSRIFFFNIF